MTEEDIVEFINAQEAIVLATKSEPYPESAYIEFGNKGLTLVFDTNIKSRKYENIMQSPEVSCVIGWKNNKTIQYEGLASLLGGKELENLKKAYFRKNPAAQEWEEKEGFVYFKIEPKWLRYTDLNVDPWDIVEFRFL